jgi:hypothetical protein
MNPANRRQHTRYPVQPGYTPVSLRLLDSERFTLEGHAYDISEGGVMFELDRGVDPGTAVAVQITLPPAAQDAGPGRSVFIFGNVVWLDDSEAGPVRMAVAFTRFARLGDRERLLRALSHGRNARAA